MAAAQSNGFNANGMMFSTPDSDNDNWANGNCVGIGDGKGWWFYHCSASCPNNEFSTGWTTGSPPSDVQVSRMLHGVVQVNITVAPSSE